MVGPRSTAGSILDGVSRGYPGGTGQDSGRSRQGEADLAGEEGIRVLVTIIVVAVVVVATGGSGVAAAGGVVVSYRVGCVVVPQGRQRLHTSCWVADLCPADPWTNSHKLDL